MHRATPENSSFRAYVAGGSRAIVPEVDDSKLMQESKGRFMANEAREAIESPQNYGFTSVVMDGDKDKEGNITSSAETFVSFMGGNRSFPVYGNMDDRRHRLKDLKKGDVAMFRTKDDQSQFHLTGDGGFWSAPQDKTARMQLVKKSQQQQSGGSGSAATLQDAGGSSGETGGQSQQQQSKDKGQKAVYKGGSKSDFFFHLTEDGATTSGKNVYLRQGTSFGDEETSSGSPSVSSEKLDRINALAEVRAQSNNIKVHVADDGNVYLGGKKGEGSFKRVLCEQYLISKNVYALIGGGVQPCPGGLVRVDENGIPIEGEEAEAAPAATSCCTPTQAALATAILFLGISIGVNYALIAEKGSMIVSACMYAMR